MQTTEDELYIILSCRRTLLNDKSQINIYFTILKRHSGERVLRLYLTKNRKLLFCTIHVRVLFAKRLQCAIRHFGESRRQCNNIIIIAIIKVRLQ